ncbi:MAG: MoaD/ThiS family protein [Planctomycetota bacterium]
MQLIIPASMRRHTGGADAIELMSPTVCEAIADACEIYPSLADSLVDEIGEIRSHLNVYVGAHDIRDLDHLQTPVGPNDEVVLVSALAGG